jgi:dihydroorotase
MPETFDLLIRGGTVVNQNGIGLADVGIRGGRFAAIGDLAQASAGETIDAKGLHVLPGVIDTQVHFREPGLEHKEDLESGTRGAVLGGVVAVFEMPNTTPLTDTAAALEDKLKRAKGRAWSDHAFFVGATAENAPHLGELERLPGCSGVKIFMGASTGNLLVADDPTLARVLAHGRRRVAVHAEDETRMKARRHLAEQGSDPANHPVWRDAESARLATERIIRLARAAKRPVHVLHVTTGDEVPLLAANKDLITMEVTPQHLTLAAEDCYARLGTRAQMNPPIREARHRDALWEAVRLGVVDVLGSDHAPHTLEEKSKPYPQSPSGMTGVQTLLPLMLNHVSEGRLTLQRLVDLTSAGPQRIYNIAGKGRLAVGYDADVTLVDLKAKRTIETSWIASKAGWTPFEGMSITGWPMGTIIRGSIVMRDGGLANAPAGEPVRFVDTLT